MTHETEMHEVHESEVPETEAGEEGTQTEAAEVIVEDRPEESEPVDELEATRQQLLRVHADFDNFRKRTRQEKEDLQRFATKSLLADLLPVADNFDRAMASMAEAPEQVRTGLEMVQRQLLQVFEKYGVESLDPVGQPFDPNLHEAVMQEPAGEGTEPGTIVQVLQKGYSLHGKILRAAMVKVSV